VQNVHTPVILNILFSSSVRSVGSSRHLAWAGLRSERHRGPRGPWQQEEIVPRYGCCPSITNRIIREPKPIFGFSGQQTGVCPILAWLSCLSARNGEVATTACPGGRGEARAGSTESHSEVLVRSRSTEVARPKSLDRSCSSEVARPKLPVRLRSGGGARAKPLDRNTRRPKGERTQAMVVPDREEPK
jgi:hypothetical protein